MIVDMLLSVSQRESERELESEVERATRKRRTPALLSPLLLAWRELEVFGFETQGFGFRI